jgi:hypothetical protein
MPAEALQGESILLVVEEETLDEKRRVEPWTIQFGDEHSQPKVPGLDLDVVRGHVSRVLAILSSDDLACIASQ